MAIQARAYQEEGVYSIFNYFEAGNTGNPVVAMPTGTGKSVVIALFLQRVLSQYPRQRIMVLTHVKELIAQNYAKLVDIWPLAPAGIYSSGLKQKDTALPIIFGGVGSVVNNVAAFGHRDLLLIDEAHLLSPSEASQYQLVIEALKRVNPWLRVIGFTATPYRLGTGMITDGPIFTDLCFDITHYEAFNRLIAEGYLCPLVTLKTGAEMNTPTAVRAGEFTQASADAALTDDVMRAALDETARAGASRRQWLAFTAGVEKAEKAAEYLRHLGVAAASVHTKLGDAERDKRIADYKRGNLRCLVNNNVLTTGFDHPPIDLISMLRPTMSPGLWVQMLGRGTRPSYETQKLNCLVLDFARNRRRLGPINDPKIPRKKGEGGGDVPVRICPACNAYNHASARNCENCGLEFEFKQKLVETPTADAMLRSDIPQVELYDVNRVFYSKHVKRDGTGKPTLKVIYACGMRMFTEWIALEHDGFAGKKARDWWRTRTQSEPPTTVDEAVTLTAYLRIPQRIHVWVNKANPEVLRYEY